MNRFAIPFYYVPCFPIRIISVKLTPPPISNPPPVKVTPRPSKRLTYTRPKGRIVTSSKLDINLAMAAPFAPIEVAADNAAVIPPLFDFHMSLQDFETMGVAVSAAESVLN